MDRMSGTAIVEAHEHPDQFPNRNHHSTGTMSVHLCTQKSNQIGYGVLEPAIPGTRWNHKC
jgi:hypothetical protein